MYIEKVVESEFYDVTDDDTNSTLMNFRGKWPEKAESSVIFLPFADDFEPWTFFFGYFLFFICYIAHLFFDIFFDNF